MRLLDRYIAKHVVGGTVLALAVVVALLSFVTFVDDLKSVGRGDYTLWHAIGYMILTLPRQMFAVLPVAAVVGSLMGLGLMATNGELAVIRAAGVSTWRLVGAVMKGAGALVVIAIVLGEGIAPYAEQLAQERRALALSGSVSLHSGEGIWLRDGNSIINIGKVLPEQRLGAISIFEFDADRRMRVVTFAKGAQFADEQWLLERVVQSQIDTDSVKSTRVEQARWDSDFRPELVSVVAVKPESLSALGLARYIRYLEENGLATARFELALWTKGVYPLATAVMIFLGLPLVLGRLRSAGMGQRILVGSLLGVAFHIVHQVMGHLGIVYGVDPGLSAFAPSLLFLVAGACLLHRLT